MADDRLSQPGVSTVETAKWRDLFSAGCPHRSEVLCGSANRIARRSPELFRPASQILRMTTPVLSLLSLSLMPWLHASYSPLESSDSRLANQSLPWRPGSGDEV